MMDFKADDINPVKGIMNPINPPPADPSSTVSGDGAALSFENNSDLNLSSIFSTLPNLIGSLMGALAPKPGETIEIPGEGGGVQFPPEEGIWGPGGISEVPWANSNPQVFELPQPPLQLPNQGNGGAGGGPMGLGFPNFPPIFPFANPIPMSFPVLPKPAGGPRPGGIPSSKPSKPNGNPSHAGPTRPQQPGKNPPQSKPAAPSNGSPASQPVAVNPNGGNPMQPVSKPIVISAPVVISLPKKI